MPTSDAERLMAKRVAYAFERCCAVPLDQEAPDCVWHGYRSLTSRLALLALPEEVCAHALHVETRAMAHAMDFLRRTIVADAQEAAAQGTDAMGIVQTLVHRLNGFIMQVTQRG